MAIAIKSIPTLKADEAQKFVNRANKAVVKKGAQDFSRELKSANAILKKAKFK